MLFSRSASDRELFSQTGICWPVRKHEMRSALVCRESIVQLYKVVAIRGSSVVSQWHAMRIRGRDWAKVLSLRSSLSSVIEEGISDFIAVFINML